MSRHIEHRLLAPDGTPLIVIAKERVRSGETIQAFIRRNEWRFDLPTRCFVNGQAIRPGQLTKIRIRVRDEIVIVSRPGLGGGSSGSPSTAKTIGSIVAMVALAVLAPWAGGAIAGAVGLAGATIAGVAYSSIFGGFILAAGGLLLSQFFKPKAAAASASPSPVYSITASGNTAKPLGMIPVGYGQRLRYPEYAAPPYSTYSGDDQLLYQLFCIGCGDYEPKVLMLDDTPFWTAQDGLNPAFADVQIQWVKPGDQVTLFPVNITSASEVSGQQMPSPSKDPIRGGWLGPFSIAPPDTETKEIWLDYVWPSGAGATRKAKEYPVNSTVLAEGRKIDGAGAPIGGESAPWVRLLEKTYSINKKTAFRVTEKVTVDGGRWQVRSRRGGDSYGDTTLDPDIQAHDDVSWVAARALIDAPQAFPGVTMLATVIKADAQLSGGSQNRIGAIACRRVEVYDGGLWSLAESRNPIDAAIDIWRNTDYSAGLSAANLVLQDLLYQRAAAAARGDTFDHFFDGALSIQDALETAMRVCKSNPAFIGDRLTIVRDEPKAPRMLFTDQEIVRGSLTIKRQLLDDTWADGVVVNYFDERTNRAASAASAHGLVRPARVEVPGVSKGDKATELARHLAAVNRYRRRRVSFQVELEGRMLKRGDLVLVQSELPQSWGQGGEVRSYLQVNGQYQITLDAPVTFTDGAPHFVMFRRRDGRPYGPIRVVPASGQRKSIALDQADLLVVQQQQGPIATLVLERPPTEDPPSYSFSAGAPREYRGLVVSATMRDFIATLETVIEAPEVYAAIGGDVPPIPNVPVIFTDSSLPVISRLAARAYQRGATLFLSVGWDPVRNAALYLAQVSIDAGSTWAEVYRNADTTFEVPAPGVSTILVRVACITVGGTICRFVQTECAVPDLAIDGELIGDFSLTLEKLSAETQAQIKSINDLGQGALALGRENTALALAMAKDTLRGALRQLQAYVDQFAEAQATQQLDTYDQRQLIKVGNSANYAAIQREETARIGADSALAGITTSLGVRLTTAEGSIAGQSTAIQGLYTSVDRIDGVLIAQGQAITTLSSRIDANDLAISGQATATQQLTTRVTLNEGNITSLSQALTALQSTVSAQGGQIQGQATALDQLTTRVTFAENSITAESSRITALESTVSSQGGAISGQATALQQLTTRTTATENGVQSNSQSISALSATVSGQGGQIGSNAQAVSQLQARADNVDGLLSSQASSIQSLSTTQQGHTATLTTYGASIDGQKVQFGVTGYIDGTSGGFVFTGVKRLDGTVSYTVNISGDLFVDRSITAPKLAVQQLILNGQIFDGAVSSIGGDDNANILATYYFTNSRPSGATKLAILAFYNPIGVRTVPTSGVGSFNILIDDNVHTSKPGNSVPGNNGSYLLGDAISKQIQVGSGTFKIQAYHTNASGGAVNLVVIELSK